MSYNPTCAHCHEIKPDDNYVAMTFSATRKNGEVVAEEKHLCEECFELVCDELVDKIRENPDILESMKLTSDNGEICEVKNNKKSSDE